MLYERMLTKEVINKYDIDLACTEYKASIYEEIASYLVDNNCSDGVNLVNKSKDEIDNFVTKLKTDLDEIENICIEIATLIKNLYVDKQDIPLTMIINNKNIFISYKERAYGFIYSIEFDEYKKLYKYGIIKANVNKGKLSNIESKIGFSDDSNLERYADFKNYFNSLLNEFDNCKSIEELDFLKMNVNNELSRLFYTEDLRIYLFDNNEEINKLTGIKGIDIVQELYQIYDINKVKIKLILNGYSIKDNKLIELVRYRRSYKELLDEIEKLDDSKDKDIKDIYIESVKGKSQKIQYLMKELNMGSAELEIAIDKVNSEN